MFIVAFRVGYENMIGLIGVAAPRDVEQEVAELILEHKQVVDIRRMRIVKEGRAYHVEALLELEEGLSLADADDIKFKVWDRLLKSDDVSDVSLGIVETNNHQDWDSNSNERYSSWSHPQRDT